jgi:hypothetical protein
MLRFHFFPFTAKEGGVLITIIIPQTFHDASFRDMILQVSPKV